MRIFVNCIATALKIVQNDNTILDPKIRRVSASVSETILFLNPIYIVYTKNINLKTKNKKIKTIKPHGILLNTTKTYSIYFSLYIFLGGLSFSMITSPAMETSSISNK